MYTVYALASSNGAVKVGVTADLIARSNDVSKCDGAHSRQGNDAGLVGAFVATSRAEMFAMERAIHEALDAFHDVGEWFTIPPDLFDRFAVQAFPEHWHRCPSRRTWKEWYVGLAARYAQDALKRLNPPTVE